MDISPFGIARNTLSHIPTILKTAFWALFGVSPNAPVQDALTETICAAARPVLGTPHALLASQKQFNFDWGVWGRMWVSKVTIAGSNDLDTRPTGDERSVDLLDAVRSAIEHLGEGNEKYDPPSITDVEAEWTGYRQGVWHAASRPRISEKEQYEKMMEEVQPASPTILYIHGGAFCLMDPSTHRWTTSALAKATSGRCLSVRYRLSPQAAFPGALVDCLMAYLYLIDPPQGSFHEAVPANEIVIAGDSSGACLGAALVLLLTTLPKIGVRRLLLHDRSIPIPTLPVAGLALTSPWLDVSRSLPSVTQNDRFDIIAIPMEGAMTPNFPHDSIWPVNPPRVETYCEASMVSHPLVSPLAARPHMWESAPPVYVNVGWEGMQDETEVFARRVSQAGDTVIFEGFVGMPHCFGMIPWCKSGFRAFEGWANFCRDAVGGALDHKLGHACWIDKDGGIKHIKLGALGFQGRSTAENRRLPLDDETVGRLMKKSREWRVEEESRLRK